MSDPFRKYDIRGIYPDEINKEFAINLAHAMVVIHKPKKIILARDIRNGSKILHQTLAKTLADLGVKVLDANILPTDAFLYATRKYKEFGIMITASHNPPEYNGFKIEHKDGTSIYSGNGLEKIKAAMKKQVRAKEKRGKIKEFDIKKEFVKFTLDFMKPQTKQQKVIIDCSGGASTEIAKLLVPKLDIKAVKMNWKPDPEFKAHSPNPLDPSVVPIMKKYIEKHDADFAVCFDSDGDRAMFFDDNGNVIDPGFIAGIIVDHVTDPIQVVADVTVSHFLKDKVKAQKGRFIPSKVGRIYISPLMKKHDAAFGVEASGHISFARKGIYAENTWMAFLAMLSIHSAYDKPFSYLFWETQKYHKNVGVKVKVKDAKIAMKKLKIHFKNKKPKLIDGITIEEKDLWFNLRASNTEPVIRVNIEANSETKLKKKEKQLITLIKKI